MLDHEPDTNDHIPSTDATADETTSSAGPAPRRRRAATRKAGPPSVSAEQETLAPSDAVGAAMTTEAAPHAEGAASPAGEPSSPADATAAPAKKTTRKRATKSTEAGTTRTPRKRASKKTAAAAEDTETALDEIRLALTAEQPPAALTEDARPEGARPEEAPTEEAPGVEDEPSAGDSAGTVQTRGTADAADVVDEADQGRTDGTPAEEQQPVDSSETPTTESPTSGTAPTETSGTEATSSEADDAVESAEGSDDDVEDEDDDSEDSGDTADESGEGGTPRRRRRRRGGRRRRRGGGGADSDQAASDGSDDQEGDSSPSSAADHPEAGKAESGPQPTEEAAADGDRGGDEESAGDDTTDEENGQRRRRRRRRRRGEDSGPAADDPAEVVVRVREPRSRKRVAQEVTGIEGSTRMEAKRQRRREGREAGRRRAPILSEAEFLARRESVVRKMIIRQREELSQIAVLEDDILVEHYVDRESAASLIGNVYLGRVQNVLPSMEAAFIDIGRGRNAVLYAGEVDWDAFGANGQQRKVENVLKSGQTVLVQVTKDPVGAKGARLTSHITLPGRYIVYAPGGHLSGISRKLPDNERKRLKSVLNDLVPESASVIVRTAAEGASEDELIRDVNRLKAQWEDIERKVKAGSAPKLLYGEPDLTVRIVRDLFTEDFAELIIQGNGSQADAYDAVDAYVGHVAPHLHDRLRRWDAAADGDLFATYRLDEQISRALERKVFLPSGGSLIIDRTEAMTVIDVNTGKFTGSGGNLEATVTSNNLEAAEEIVRQLRLRDVGGIIVIDFIDMVLPSNRELLLRRLVECLGRDRTRHQVAEVTSLGLVQMTRKKIGTGLLEAFTTECEHCHGRGYEISDVPVETQKQPDGGSRDQRGGGGGGGRDRGRGRGNQSGSGSNTKAQHPVPTPPSHRPAPSDEGSAGGEPDGSGDGVTEAFDGDRSGSQPTPESQPREADHETEAVPAG